jgi:hypothetical protein
MVKGFFEIWTKKNAEKMLEFANERSLNKFHNTKQKTSLFLRHEATQFLNGFVELILFLHHFFQNLFFLKENLELKKKKKKRKKETDMLEFGRPFVFMAVGRNRRLGAGACGRRLFSSNSFKKIKKTIKTNQQTFVLHHVGVRNWAKPPFEESILGDTVVIGKMLNDTPRFGTQGIAQRRKFFFGNEIFARIYQAREKRFSKNGRKTLRKNANQSTLGRCG